MNENFKDVCVQCTPNIQLIKHLHEETHAKIYQIEKPILYFSVGLLYKNSLSDVHPNVLSGDMATCKTNWIWKSKDDKNIFRC